ncbi:MAG: hypothetical protein RL172_1459 [Bacteroidota bacterium]|jgi:hypothetical protein
MKKILLGAAMAALVIAFYSCGTSGNATGVWANKEKLQGKSYSKIFIVVMTADVSARDRLESDIAAKANEYGYATVKSAEVIPIKLSDPVKPTKEAITAAVQNSGCDAVFISTMLNKSEDIRYTPGNTVFSPMPYYSWSGNYFGYYSHFYPTISQPGYYSTDKTYFLQSNLYDVASEELMWSVQSKVFNPTSLEKFSKSYTNTLLKQLESEHLIKKQ